MGNTSFISTLITTAASLFLESRKAVCPLARAARSRTHSQQGQGSEIEFPSSQHHAAAAHNDIKAIMFYISIPCARATN
jgi:hypothetical protein